MQNHPFGGPESGGILSEDRISAFSLGVDFGFEMTITPMNKAFLSEKFSKIQEHWRPKVVAQLNRQEAKRVKFKGVFPWHHREQRRELPVLICELFGELTTSEQKFSARGPGCRLY